MRRQALGTIGRPTMFPLVGPDWPRARVPPGMQPGKASNRRSTTFGSLDTVALVRPAALHHYHFRLLALSVDQLTLGNKPSSSKVEREARKHAIAEATLVGLYQR